MLPSGGGGKAEAAIPHQASGRCSGGGRCQRKISDECHNWYGRICENPGLYPGKEIEPEIQPIVTEGNLNGKHILVAEDNRLNMEIVTELSEEQAMEVAQAFDGRQALEL